LLARISCFVCSKCVGRVNNVPVHAGVVLLIALRFFGARLAATFNPSCKPCRQHFGRGDSCFLLWICGSLLQLWCERFLRSAWCARGRFSMETACLSSSKLERRRHCRLSALR
jgi:hypothetical protein